MKARLVDRSIVKRPEVAETAPPPPLSDEERAIAARMQADQEARERIERELAEARESAERLVDDARTTAAQLLEQAHAEARTITAEATRKGEEAIAVAAKTAADEARAGLAAGWLVLHEAEERSVERQMDRIAGLAGVVAERLLGQALALGSDAAVLLARRALRELRDARAVRIEVHPQDARALREAFTAGGAGAPTELALTVVEADACERGSFRMQTALGSLHIDLRPRIERLASALRDTLKTAAAL